MSYMESLSIFLSRLPSIRLVVRKLSEFNHDSLVGSVPRWAGKLYDLLSHWILPFSIRGR